ncbi:single-strand DNA endonuclease ASTE1-like [Ptychodera flava]|uniref:single-strand DNA endonuclease ASTE1-like n=1 Tax=Ptychodera flava TaxID=63121 RepID=UPI00396A99F5
MGVLGLTSFVENTPQLLLPLKIHDTRLVVDGHGLVHYLFHHSKIGYRHGGNYSEYEDLCVKFFKFLNLCNIKVYILFDGAHDLEDKKFRTTKERAKQQIQRSLNIINGGGDRILPVFAFEVFVKVMDGMEIPFVYCDFEADNDIVALANAWGCSVLSQDSDFFVFDVKAGYIQLSHFWWKNPCILHAKKGEDEDQGCPVPDEEAPMVRLPARFVRSVSKRNSHIQGTIYWLSEFEELNTAITAVLKYLRKTEREQIRQKLETSMQMYDLQVGSKFKNYFERCHMDSGLLTFQHCPALPGWAVALFRHGKFPFFCTTVLCQRRHFTFNLIEDVTQKSCNRGPLNVRRVLYGILLKQFSIEESENNRDIMQGGQVDKSKKTLHVMEFDRDNLDLRQTRVEPLFHLPKCGNVPGISNIPELAVASRKCLLMEVLGIDPVMVESFPLDIQLPVAVTVFWVHNADPEIVPSHLQALLLGFLKGCLSESLDQETQHCPETHEDDNLSESKEVPGEDSAKVKGDEPSVTQQGAASFVSGTDERTNVKQLLSKHLGSIKKPTNRTD